MNYQENKIVKESNLRSLLKGISWRVIATADTLAIVLIYTCIQGSCSVEDAFKIGLYEFFIKFFIYFFHERIWQYSKKNSESVNKLLYKTITWRFIATLITFIITGTILKSFGDLALFIAITELFTKMILYYLHEKLWLFLPLGTIRKYLANKIYGEKRHKA